MAWRSRHRRLLDQVDGILGGSGADQYTQWSVQDFAPIARAIDDLMAAIKWATYG